MVYKSFNTIIDPDMKNEGKKKQQTVLITSRVLGQRQTSKQKHNPFSSRFFLGIGKVR